MIIDPYDIHYRSKKYIYICDSFVKYVNIGFNPRVVGLDGKGRMYMKTVGRLWWLYKTLLAWAMVVDPGYLTKIQCAHHP